LSLPVEESPLAVEAELIPRTNTVSLLGGIPSRIVPNLLYLRNDSGDLFARSTQNEIYSLACQVFGHTANFGCAFERVVMMNHH
jgi:hypothetical protein